MDPNAALSNIRRAAKLGRGGDTIDAFEGLDAWLVSSGGFLPDSWAGTLPLVAWVADDMETCLFCAWPESSTVVLRIGRTIAVCQEHIWRGLLAKLGEHPREGMGYPAAQEA